MPPCCKAAHLYSLSQGERDRVRGRHNATGSAVAPSPNENPDVPSIVNKDVRKQTPCPPQSGVHFRGRSFAMLRQRPNNPLRRGGTDAI